MIAKNDRIILELDSGVETVTDTVTNVAKHFVYLPPLGSIPTPILEDLFHTINAELMFRDRKFIEENLS